YEQHKKIPITCYDKEQLFFCCIVEDETKEIEEIYRSISLQQTVRRVHYAAAKRLSADQCSCKAITRASGGINNWEWTRQVIKIGIEQLQQQHLLSETIARGLHMGSINKRRWGELTVGTGRVDGRTDVKMKMITMDVLYANDTQ
ncbi:unnamed protein product, partial [Ceratitis capitata]